MKPDDGVGRRLDRDVDPVVVAGRVGYPRDAAGRALANALFRVLHREGRRIDEAAVRELDVTVPRRQAIAPADTGARPADPVSSRALERLGRVRRERPYLLQPAEDVHTLDRPRPHGAAAHRDPTFGTPGGAHRQTIHGEIDVDSLRGGDAVAAAGLDRVEHGLARQ